MASRDQQIKSIEKIMMPFLKKIKKIIIKWWCTDCEHGPMDEKDDKCSRCGTKNSQYQSEEEMTGWEDEDIESEVEEIW